MINEPGNYVLTQDIGSGSASDCLTIAANNVHLNTARHGIGAIGTALIIRASHVLIDGGGSFRGGNGIEITAKGVVVDTVGAFSDNDLGCW
ncbi:MAG: hypothetical protein JO166_14625 [Deltaproteobacteria bacterium]|nr:hypothetical protein [Deltaproteobacteria bacterium]